MEDLKGKIVRLVQAYDHMMTFDPKGITEPMTISIRVSWGHGICQPFSDTPEIGRDATWEPSFDVEGLNEFWVEMESPSEDCSKAISAYNEAVAALPQGIPVSIFNIARNNIDAAMEHLRSHLERDRRVKVKALQTLLMKHRAKVEKLESEIAGELAREI